MGLDCSHDAFSGAYSSFNRLRQAVARAIGGSFPPHYLYNANGDVAEVNGMSARDETLDEGIFYVGDGYSQATHPGIWEFLLHSDCDGEISPEMCAKVADDLSPLLPALEAMGDGGGHISRDGGYAAVLARFIAGCRDAHAAGEPLEFH